MKRRLIAGNWKMNGTVSEAIPLVQRLKVLISDVQDRDIAICPPFTILDTVSRMIVDSRIYLGAQDMFWEEKGAFTGEISPLMLKEFNCTFVILGHSERRWIIKETDEVIAKKVKSAIDNSLTPILCIGERLEDRECNRTEEVIISQLEGSLSLISEPDSIVIAYEPVWAIGTGKPAYPSDAVEVISLIKEWYNKKFGEERAKLLRVLYGGSVTPSNIDDFMREEEIDGALVGGASLNAESFARIIKYLK
jgi:triosephosphate isomerase